MVGLSEAEGNKVGYVLVVGISDGGLDGNKEGNVLGADDGSRSVGAAEISTEPVI